MGLKGGKMLPLVVAELKLIKYSYFSVVYQVYLSFPLIINVPEEYYDPMSIAQCHASWNVGCKVQMDFHCWRLSKDYAPF